MQVLKWKINTAFMVILKIVYFTYQKLKLISLKNAPNPPTPPTPINNAPKPHKGKGAKVGILGTHKAKTKRNFRNSRGAKLLGTRI
tara:strand:- start:430 stop:687 length:258 start_codon:yes stop_codon:yes gene_type:complete